MICLSEEQLNQLRQHSAWVRHGDCADPVTADALDSLLDDYMKLRVAAHAIRKILEPETEEEQGLVLCDCFTCKMKREKHASNSQNAS